MNGKETHERMAIAARFASILQDDLTPAQWDEMQRRNALPDYEGPICASHDFCDANMPMNEAFKSIMGREIDHQSDDDSATWSTAWDIAALAAQLQASRSSDEGKAILRKSRDEARAMAITAREKRRKAVMLARGLQKRLSGEYRLNGRLQDQKRDAFKRLAQETSARLAAENALAAIEARLNGWPPAVRSLSVNFRKAA